MTDTLNADGNTKFKVIFPLFRGAALFILSFWLVALNVFVWTKYHVNYKHVFDFKNHFSQISEILKRASFFTFIYLVMFIWYVLVSSSDKNLLSPYISWLPE